MDNKYKYMSQAGYTEAEIEKYDELSNRGYSPSQAMDIIRGGKSEPVYVQKYEPKETVEITETRKPKIAGISAKGHYVDIKGKPISGKMGKELMVTPSGQEYYRRKATTSFNPRGIQGEYNFTPHEDLGEGEHYLEQPISEKEVARQYKYAEKFNKLYGVDLETGHKKPGFDKLRLMKEKIAIEQKLIQKIKSSEKKALSEEDIRQRAKLRARLEYEAQLKRMRRPKQNIATRLTRDIFGSMGTSNPVAQRVRVQKVRIVRQPKTHNPVTSMESSFLVDMGKVKSKKKSRSTDPFGASNYF